MKLSRIACSLLVPFSVSVLDCEPMDEAPPPATPQPVTNLPPPPAPPDPAPPAAEEDDSKYASDEVAIGGGGDEYDDDDPAALTDFRAALQPYGTWVDDPTYGTVWAPSADAVGPDFSPYVTAGHWAYDDDWVWVSDYEWGWGPFHYGRWVLIEGRGWVWIPGRVYRGAWVSWGIDDGYTYVGWAPLPPSFVWFGGVPVAFPVYVAPRWVYCPRGDVFAPGLRGRVVAGASAAPVAMRVRPYVPASPGVATAGPPPQKLGFQAAQIPHATGTAAGVVRAQQFAHPSTAQSLGAHPPTRVAPVAPAMPAAHVAPAAALGGGPRVGTGAVAGAAPAARAPAAGQGPGTGTGHAAPSTGAPGRVAPGGARPSSRSPGFRGGFHGGGGHRH